MTNTVVAIFFLFAVFLTPITVLAESDDIEKEGIAKCTQLASQMFNNNLAIKQKSKQLGKPSHVTHIESFLVWRASCAEKPPTGQGNVTALCQGSNSRPLEKPHVINVL